MSLLLGLSPAVPKVFESGIDLSGAAAGEENALPRSSEFFISFNMLLEARLRLLESSGNVFGVEDDSSETRRTISWRSKEIRVSILST